MSYEGSIVFPYRDTAGQERFETLTAQYYRRAQGILLLYDITQEQSFANVTKWLRNIEEVSLTPLVINMQKVRLIVNFKEGCPSVIETLQML